MSNKNQIILVGGRPLHYRVRRNKRSRRFRVNVSEREGVVVVIPWRLSMKEVLPMLQEFEPWLEEKVDECGCWHGPVVKQYASGSEVLVLGEPRVLDIAALPGSASRARITLEPDRLRMVLPPGDIWDPRPALEKWLRRFARRHLEGRLAVWSQFTGLEPEKVIVGERKTRWGSCSSRRTLSFCYRLVMAPESVIDAIVVHELCHLVYMDHGPRFRELLGSYIPWHEDADQWLRDHHEQLRL